MGVKLSSNPKRESNGMMRNGRRMARPMMLELKARLKKTGQMCRWTGSQSPRTLQHQRLCAASVAEKRLMGRPSTPARLGGLAENARSTEDRKRQKSYQLRAHAPTGKKARIQPAERPSKAADEQGP